MTRTIETERTAELSPDGRYRWTLSRSWGDSPHTLGWIMLNPSTADANADDATIRRLINFSRSFGYKRLRVVNLFAYRATRPRDLLHALQGGVDIVGERNDEVTTTLLVDCAQVIAAWGATEHPAGPARAERVVELAGAKPLYCLGMTASGAPRHPLYMPTSSYPLLWPGQ